jgi:hypothetical protein
MRRLGAMSLTEARIIMVMLKLVIIAKVKGRSTVFKF